MLTLHLSTKRKAILCDKHNNMLRATGFNVSIHIYQVHACISHPKMKHEIETVKFDFHKSGRVECMASATL